MRSISKLIDSFKAKPIDAKSAYSVAAYGANVTDEEVVDLKIKQIKEAIGLKCARGEFALITPLDSKIPDYFEKVKSTFQTDGFNVELIDNTVFTYIKDPYIFIYWDR